MAFPTGQVSHHSSDFHHSHHCIIDSPGLGSGLFVDDWNSNWCEGMEKGQEWRFDRLAIPLSTGSVGSDHFCGIVALDFETVPTKEVGLWCDVLCLH